MNCWVFCFLSMDHDWHGSRRSAHHGKRCEDEDGEGGFVFLFWRPIKLTDVRWTAVVLKFTDGSLCVLESVYIGVPVSRGDRRKRRRHRHTSRHSHERDSRDRRHNRHEHTDREEACEPDEERDSNELLSDINSTSERKLYWYRERERERCVQ